MPDKVEDEVRSIYVGATDRYVVMLVVGYKGGADGVGSPEEAAFYALDLTQDDGWSDTTWVVLDRATGQYHALEQDDFARWEAGCFVRVRDDDDE